MSPIRDILMVEDNATDAELAAWALKSAGIVNPLRVVVTGEAGIAHLHAPPVAGEAAPALPQLILLDLNLPAMPGLEFLRQVKADARTRDIPVVVLSLTEKDRDIMACLRLGAAGQIVKPVDFETLIRITNRLKLPLTLKPRSSQEG